MAVRMRDWSAIRRWLWGLALGLAAGGLLMSGRVPHGAGIVAACVAVAAIAAIAIERRFRSLIVSAAIGGDDPYAAALTPLAREIFERLPDPLLLLDASGRVVFANKEMANAVGTDPARKPISAVLRMPAVLNAVQRTVETGEPASVAFTTPVPVQRHYQA